MSTGSKAWLLLAIPDRLHYAGKPGYDDDPASTYRYDSAVPNSRWVSQGDLVLLRDRETFLGVGLVERIVSGSRKRLRCPVCNVAKLKERHRAPPVEMLQSPHICRSSRGRDCRRTLRSSLRKDVSSGRWPNFGRRDTKNRNASEWSAIHPGGGSRKARRASDEFVSRVGNAVDRIRSVNFGRG